MFAFVTYEAKVAIILAAFYLCYKLLLSKETLHRLNRAVLLGTALLSFALPLCVITFHRVIEIAAVQTFGVEAGEMMPVGAVQASESMARAASGGFNWQAAIMAIYLAGAAVVLAGLTVSMVRVFRLIKSGSVETLEGQEVVVCDTDIAPFSWMRWIVMSREDFESGNMHILEHEKAHIALGHSVDVMVVNLLAVLQWFNPAVWLLKADLCAIHEYEADDAVLRQGANIKEYQYSLIRKAVLASGYTITNNFNHSILKNRITMMSKTKSVMAKGLKVLYVIPMVAAVLACNSRTETVYTDSEVIEEPEGMTISLQEETAGEFICMLDGEQIVFDGISAAVGAGIKESGDSLVIISAPSNVKYGVIDDIVEELRSIDGLRVKYSCPEIETEAANIPEKPKIVVSPTGVEVYKFDNVRNVLAIHVNSLDKILFGSTVIEVPDVKDMTVEALRANHKMEISLQCDRATSYGVFVSLQEDVHNAVNAVRDGYAMETYGKSFDELDDVARQEVLDEIPLRIYMPDPRTRLSSE